MTEKVRDRLTGLVLLAAALVWSTIVYLTIQPGSPGEVGPRAFPLFFGLLLAVLSAIMIVRTYFMRSSDTPQAGDKPNEGVTVLEVRMVLGTIALIVIYAFVMEKISFLLATPLAVIAGFVLILRITNPVLVLGTAIGLTIGCYLVFGKLMGAYLPPGTWITVIL